MWILNNTATIISYLILCLCNYSLQIQSSRWAYPYANFLETTKLKKKKKTQRKPNLLSPASYLVSYIIGFPSKENISWMPGSQINNKQSFQNLQYTP